MPVIYEPKGRAREYAPLACNLMTGCVHACRYCYCPAILRKTRAEWAVPRPRKDVLKQLEREAQARAGDPREILFSFISDPYQTQEAAELTRAALEICGKYARRVTVLTKNGSLAAWDFKYLASHHWSFGSTVCFLDERLRAYWEPCAPTISGRLSAIREAHEHGIRTWVSVEPVVDAEAALEVMRVLWPVVDYWKVGKINHDRATEAATDWRAFLLEARAILAGSDVYWKRDLLDAAGEA